MLLPSPLEFDRRIGLKREKGSLRNSYWRQSVRLGKAFALPTFCPVCTFQLIVKNASSLLEDKNPVKLEAEAMLDDLINSFTSLNSLANESDIQVASSRQRVADALMDTITSLDKFEQGVKDCLEA
ncbi:uncharacterized protein LOC111312719 isoform X2 [Durio zibethinus]|uniref:Uncharacterized protein LOC111312719 isoform X2 n=1 Tax=Durio zibethinus TaxID=66656 RepID=A0A6P6AVZ2_DURZI|nr:uncharacterized protein LOC111312719 isoform X2 [Durio zibethinus]